MSNNGNPAQKRKATASVDEEDKRVVKRLDNGNQFRKETNHYDSRIVRVSRGSGGKDRHSKVLTAKGLRDRRVRLSVSTAIQFYDLQDRLGFDQPSKALEWLIKAAADAIDQLPALQMPINANGIAYHPSNRVAASNQLTSTVALTRRAEKVSPVSTSSDESNRVKRHVVDEEKTLAEIPPGSNSGYTSEGGENSSAGLSLCRSDSRLKARERAKERANIKGKGLNIKEKSLSFTDLLQNVVSIESQEINNNSSTRQDNDPGPMRNENDINSMRRENNNSNTLRRQNDRSSMRREEGMNQVQIVEYHDQNGSYQQQNNVMEQTALGLVSSDNSSQNFSFSNNNVMISNNNKQASGLAFMANAFPIVGNPIIHGNCSALMEQGGGATGTTSHSQHDQMMSFSPISSRETLQSNSYNNLMMNYYMQSQHPQSLLHRLNQLIAGGHIHAYDAVRIMERPIFQLDSVDASSRSDVNADRKPSHPSYN